MSGMDQTIIVESNNLSFSTNTNSRFSARLPKELAFKSTHEIGVLEVCIPNTVFNINDEAFLGVAIYHKHKATGRLADDEPFRQYTASYPEAPVLMKHYSEESLGSLTPSGPAPLVTLNLIAFMKVRVEAGFYSSIKDLTAEVDAQNGSLFADSSKIYNGCNHDSLLYTAAQFLSEKKANTASQEGFLSEWSNKMISNAEPGGYFFGGLRHVIGSDSLQSYFKSTLQGLLKRISYSKHTRGYLKLLTSKKAIKKDLSIHFSKDVGFIVGYPHTDHFFLPASSTKVHHAPFISRIQSVDTMYLYSSDVRHSIVSEYETPILRCIPFGHKQMEFGEVFVREFLVPVYVELLSHRIRNLNFELRDSGGSLIRFQGGSQAVRLVLRLREKH